MVRGTINDTRDIRSTADQFPFYDSLNRSSSRRKVQACQSAHMELGRRSTEGTNAGKTVLDHWEVFETRDIEIQPEKLHDFK